MEHTTKSHCILRMKDLPKKIGYQPSTIYQLISKGQFPTPFKLTPGGRAAGWLESTIDEWISSRASNSEPLNSN